jgi:glycosyltransferase involved in cell wall biosynthesis
MRILIDTTQIPLARTGVGIYAENLIKEIAVILRPEDTLFLLIQDDDQSLRMWISKHAQIRPLHVPSRFFRNRIALALYEQCILPWVLLQNHIDIVHSLHYTFPLFCPCSRIVTIHDMTFFLCPQMHTRSKRVVMPFFIKMALRYAEGVLFVSESTRKDAERMFGPESNLRAVTPLGVEEACFAVVPQQSKKDTLSRLKVKVPYILYLGTLEPRKNVLRLIQAFELIGNKYPQHALVIAGGLGWNYKPTLDAIEQSPLKHRILRLGYIASEDKLPLIAGCDLMAYPSLYEGFGLPVLEGMAAGVPVVTSNVSSLPEVAGPGAALIDPFSLEELAKAIETVVENRKYRDSLIVAGKQQAKAFRWEKTAELTYHAYKTMYTVRSLTLSQ